MARPTRKIVYKQQLGEVQGTSQQELELPITESLSELLAVAQKLHEKGFLRMLSTLLDKSGDVSRAFIDWMSEPDNVRFIRNAALLYGVLKDVDSEKLRRFAFGLNKALEVASAEMEKEKKVGMVGLVKALNDPDVNRGVRAMVGLLKGLGEASREQ